MRTVGFSEVVVLKDSGIVLDDIESLEAPLIVRTVCEFDSLKRVNGGGASEFGEGDLLSFGDKVLLKVEKSVHYCEFEIYWRIVNL